MTGYRCVRDVLCPKWDPDKLSHSPLTVKLLEYAEKKFPKKLALILVLKILSIISCKLGWPMFGLMCVTPTRQLKSYLSKEAMKIMDQIFWLDTLSDFTIHSLENYKEIIANNVCIMVNDGTILFASLNKRTKDRLVGALAELLSDGHYVNQNFRGKVVDLEGQVTIILNLTSEAFKNYKDRMLGLTFLERILTIHYVLTKQEIELWVSKQQKTKKLKFGRKISINDIETNVKDIPPYFMPLIKKQAREFSYLSMRSNIGCQDVVKAILRAHAALNNRKTICSDDFYFLQLIKPFLINPFNPLEGKIVKLKAKGFSVSQICEKLGKKRGYSTQVNRIIEKATLRGILPLKNE